MQLPKVPLTYVTPGEFQWVSHDTIPLIEVCRKDAEPGKYNDIELQLGLIPDPEALAENHFSEFYWNHRTLLKVTDLPAGSEDGVERADYLMYVCLHLDQEKYTEPQDIERQHNDYLSGLTPDLVPIFGPGFIFKKKRGSGESGDSGPAQYINHLLPGMEGKKFFREVVKKLMATVLVEPCADGEQGS